MSVRSPIGRWFPVLIALGASAWAWADLTNIAQVSFVTAAGNLVTHFSNTVTVLTDNLPPPPIITGFQPYNSDLQSTDTLSLDLTGGTPDRLDWVFTTTTIPTANRRFTAAASAVAFPVSTASPSLTLGSVANLSPGHWHVSVTATNRGGTSAPAEADFNYVASVVSAVQVYPNPWRQDKHSGRSITFDQLPGDVTIKIFSASGHQVATIGPGSGKLTWDLHTDSGDPAASGLYLYLVTDSQDHHSRGKIAIIR